MWAHIWDDVNNFTVIASSIDSRLKSTKNIINQPELQSYTDCHFLMDSNIYLNWFCKLNKSRHIWPWKLKLMGFVVLPKNSINYITASFAYESGWKHLNSIDTMHLTFEHNDGKLHLPLSRQFLGSHHLEVSCKPVLLLCALNNSSSHCCSCR